MSPPGNRRLQRCNMDRIINADRLTGHGNIKGREFAAQIIDAGMSAGNPYYNVKRLIRVVDGALSFNDPLMVLRGDPAGGAAIYNLDGIDRIYIFAVGKGMQYPVRALEEVLGDLITGGLVICKHGDAQVCEKLPVVYGGHPIPDRNAIEGCARILEIAKSANFTERDLVISVMGSGIGSLCTLPAEGISLDDVERYNYLCQIDKGMPTGDLSFIRNQIDRIKGGRFTRAMQPARMVNLISGGSSMAARSYDEVVTRNTWIHSLPDGTTTEGAIAAAKKWGVWDTLPRSIVKKLESNPPGGDTLSAGEFEKYDIRVFCVVPTELNALATARRKAEELGFKTVLMTEFTGCEASAVGVFMGQVALNCAKKGEPFKAPVAIFTAGELITTVAGEGGVGGTNQEYCLAAAGIIKGNDKIVIAAVDTDGTDGPGGDFHFGASASGINVLAGGMVDGFTLGEAEQKGVDIFSSLKKHDSSAALWELDSGIAAKQNISVGDLHCVLVME